MIDKNTKTPDQKPTDMKRGEHDGREVEQCRGSNKEDTNEYTDQVMNQA